MKSTDNSILREFRIWDTEYDGEHAAFEWAFQANTHLQEQGTVPAERGFFKPYPPTPRAEADESGEDYYYWVIEDCEPSLEEIEHAADVLTRLYVLRRTD